MMDRKDKQTEKQARGAMGGEAAEQSRGRRDQGDNRTPDGTIGRVKYADNEGGGEQKKQGESTRITASEKPGGVGGR